MTVPESFVNPTPEFNEQCMAIFGRWQSEEITFADAHDQLDKLRTDARTAKHIPNEARAEHIMGYIQHQRGQIDVSIKHYDRASELFDSVGNEAMKLICTLNQGENYRLQGNYRKARRIYQDTAALAGKLGNIYIQTTAVTNEAHMLLNLDQYPAAQIGFEQAQQLAEQWTERLNLIPALTAEIHSGLAQAYRGQNRLEDAWKHTQLAREKATESSDPMQIGLANRVTGEILMRLQAKQIIQSDEDPVVYFDAALKTFDEIKAQAEIAHVMIAQAQYTYLKGSYDEAEKKLDTAIRRFTQLGMVDEAAKAIDAFRNLKG